MKYKIIRSSDELYHHGIIGMKWGVRRYQNADGSLTNAGKKRYRTKTHEDYKRAHSRKKVSEMSDRELIDRINRLNNEQNYKRLRSKNLKGKKFVKGYIATAGAIAGVAASTKIYKKYGEEILSKVGDVAAYLLVKHH